MVYKTTLVAPFTVTQTQVTQDQFSGDSSVECEWSGSLLLVCKLIAANT